MCGEEVSCLSYLFSPFFFIWVWSLICLGLSLSFTSERKRGRRKKGGTATIANEGERPKAVSAGYRLRLDGGVLFLSSSLPPSREGQDNPQTKVTNRKELEVEGIGRLLYLFPLNVL